MKIKKIFLLGIIFFGLLNNSFGQTTYYTLTAGNWTSGWCWNTNECGNLSPAWSNPGAGDDVVICEDDVITLNADRTINDLTIESGGVLDLANRDLTIDGNLILNGSIITQNGKLIFDQGGHVITGGGVFTSSNNGFINFDASATISGTDIRIIRNNSGTIIDIAAGVTITHNGNTTVYGDIIGGNATTSIWTNTSDSYLTIDGALLSTGVLNASTSGNTVEYLSADNALNIKTPSSSTYNNLEVNGTTTKTQQAALTINDNFTINSGTYNCGNYNLTIKGNWSNSGTFTYGTGTVTFNGTTDQSITNTSDETFYNLIINKSSGAITSDYNIAVNNTITLTSGNIEIPDKTLTLGTATTNTGILSWTDGYIIGTMTRWLSKVNHDATQVNFPIGVDGSYRAFKPTFTFTGGAGATDGGSLTINFDETAPGNSGLSFSDNGTAIRNTFMDGFWAASNSGLAAVITDFDLTLHGTDFQSFLPHSDGDSIRVCVWNQGESKWYAKGTHVDASGSTAYRTSIDTLPSKFCFGSAKNCTPPSTSTITGDADVCTSETGVAYSVTDTDNSTYIWSFEKTDSDSIASGANTNAITVNWGATGQTDVVIVREQNSCSLGEAITFDVDVHSLSPTEITGDMSVPVSQSGVAYTAELDDYTNYTIDWTVTGETSSTESGTYNEDITVDWNGTAGDGTLSATATYSGCAVSSSTDTTVLKYEIIESMNTGDWDYTGSIWFLYSDATWNCQCVPSSTDNIKVNNEHTVDVASASTTINHVTIEAGGEIDVGNNNNFIITGDFIINGVFSGSQGVELSGTDTYIGGVGGSIEITDPIEITSGNKNVKSTANLIISGEDVEIASGVTVTNNGSITISGYDLVGEDADSKWINDEKSTLTIDGVLLSLGTLTTSADDNTVHYNGTSAQNIKTPASSTYYNLELTGASTKTQQASLTLSGNLTINSGTLASGNNDIDLAGNWENEGAYTEGTSTVTFNGTDTQSITNSSDETFNNLIVNKSDETLTLIDNVDVTAALTMTEGNIDAATNSKTLTLGTSTEGTLNYTSGTIIGDFDRYLTATGSKLFPVGTSSVYHPITFDFNDDPTDGSILVAFTASDPGLNGTTFPFTDDVVDVTDYFNDGYWSTTITDLATTNFDMELTATGFDDDGSFSINSATRILKRTTGVWAVEGTHVNASGSTLYRDGMTLSAGNTYMFGLGDSDCATFASPTITGDVDVCSGETGVAYSVPANASNTFDWSVVKGTIASETDHEITIDWQATADVLAYVRVIESSNCYDAAQSEKEVTIHSLPTSSISGAEMVFDNTADWPYSVTARSGYTYAWSITAGNGTIVDDGDATDESIQIDWGDPSSATIQVVGTKTGCSSATAVTLYVDVFSSYYTDQDGNWSTGATWAGDVAPTSAQNAKILNAVTISSNTEIVNFYIESGASLTQTGGVDLTITGNYFNDGTHNAATGDIILNASTTGLVINGTGTVSNVGDFQINYENFIISSSAGLTINATQLSIGNGLYLNNEGTLTVSNNIVGGNTSSTFNNKTDATLNIGGTLLSTGVIIASATGNTVNFNGSGAQTIKLPQSSTYNNISASTSGTKTLVGNISIYGNLVIAGAGTLDASGSDYDIILYGNWANTSSGGFTEQSGKVFFKGTGAQTITNASGETFYDIEINQNLNQITTLNNDITVSNNLLLSRGYINGNSNKVIIIDNATTNEGNSNSYIEGQVSKIGNEAFIFPIGDGDIWARLGISSTSDVNNQFTGMYTRGTHSDISVSGGLNNVSAIEYWELSRDVGTDDVFITLYCEDSTLSGIDDEVDLTIGHYNGTDWVEEAATASFTGVVGTITTDAVVTSFSPFSFASNSEPENPLPVELLSFTGNANQSTIKLNWATASEDNNDYFELQRSIDAVNFITIGTVYGAGNSYIKLNYDYVDKSPSRGTNYYRLMQVDYNGNTEYHETIAVNWNGTVKHLDSDDINIYPNPYTSGDLILDLRKLKSNTSITLIIMDIDGRLIYKASMLIPADRDINIVPLAIDRLNQGVYFISVQTANNVLTKKVIVK